MSNEFDAYIFHQSRSVLERHLSLEPHFQRARVCGTVLEVNNLKVKDVIRRKDLIHEQGRENNMTNDKYISTINSLVETNKDGQNGYKEAAEGVERSDLKKLFYDFSQERSKFAGELQTLVRELGGEPEDSGSFSGTIHQGWMNLKSAITGQDEKAILNECERGEDSAVSAYQNALEEELPANVRSIVQTQATAVKDAHDKIKALRDMARAATNYKLTNEY